jgi:hypothetical protein
MPDSVQIFVIHPPNPGKKIATRLLKPLWMNHTSPLLRAPCGELSLRNLLLAAGWFDV